VSVPGLFTNELFGNPDPEEDEPEEEPSKGEDDAQSSSDQDESDRAFEKSTAGQVVLGVIHNPNF